MSSSAASDSPSAAEIEAAKRTLFAAGLQVRRQVAGPEYVEANLSKATAFSQRMQDYVTSACWGTIWTRPGLSLRMRSLLNIAMMCALNRDAELAVHVRGAVRNGCTEEEIAETVLHASVYCGMPAGMEGFKVAERVINEMKEKGEGAREDAKAC